MGEQKHRPQLYVETLMILHPIFMTQSKFLAFHAIDLVERCAIKFHS